MNRFTALLLLLLCVAPLRLGAGEATQSADTLTMRHIFETARIPALELLSLDTRRDMAIYHEYGRDYTAQNELRGESRLLSLSPAEATVQTSATGLVQLALLGKWLAVVYTVGFPSSPDSQLSFYLPGRYDAPLPLKNFFRTPVLADFLRPGSEARALQELVPFLLVSYRIDTAATPPTLTATLNLQGSVSEEDLARLRPALEADSIVYTWRGKKFELNK